jgi:hypothetical protein
MYPRLPSTTMQESMGAGYPTGSSAAPPSTLSGIFDHDDRRCYTGGTLQRAPPANRSHPPEAMDVTPDPDALTSSVKEAASQSESASATERFSSSLIDPALQRSSSPDPETVRAAQAATEAADRAEEQWVEHVRLIENLRRYISDRLARGDYEGDDDKEMPPRLHSPAGYRQMEGVESTADPSVKRELDLIQLAKRKSEVSLYPSLKVEDSQTV